MCPSPNKNKTHWDILSEQKTSRTSFSENETSQTSQTNSTPMLKVQSFFSPSCDQSQSQKFSSRHITQLQSLRAERSGKVNQACYGIAKQYWQSIQINVPTPVKSTYWEKKRKRSKNLMDIQRPIQYYPTDNRVEISVHILCIVSENIYCIIHPLRHTSIQSRQSGCTIPTQQHDSSHTKLNQCCPLPLFPVGQLSANGSWTKWVQVWDQFSGFFLTSSHRWLLCPVSCSAQ